MTQLPPTSNRANVPARSRFGAEFWMFLLGQTVSNVGSSFTIFVLPLLVFKLTGSAFNLALVASAEYIPYLLFGLIIGAWVDRVDRRRLMILTDIAQALVISSIPLLGALGLLSVWWISAVPSLVPEEDLPAANGYLQASYATATVVGPLLAGLLVAVAPIHLVLVVDALSFLVSALAVGLVKVSFNDADSAERQRSERLQRDVVEGLRYVLGHPILRNTCLMMALVSCVGFTVYAQLVFYAKERLGASDTQVGLLYAAGSV